MLYPLILLLLVSPSLQEILRLDTYLEWARAAKEDALNRETGCVDKSKDCGRWFTEGYCQETSKYNAYMLLNCKHTCEFCDHCDYNNNNIGNDNSVKCDPKSKPTLKECMKSTTGFSGMNWDIPNIINEEDGSKFTKVSYVGEYWRRLYDYRVKKYIYVKAFVFNAYFSDRMTVQVWVNPEFETIEKAEEQATKYSKVLGRIPKVLRARLTSLHLNKGTSQEGGHGGASYEYRYLTLNTGMGEELIEAGAIEGFFIHECGHLSFQIEQKKPEWICAANDDGSFITKYAADNPEREDVAESLVAWYAVTFEPERVSKADKEMIEKTIPNRLEYFNQRITV